MSFNSEYQELRKKRKKQEEENKQTVISGNPLNTTKQTKKVSGNPLNDIAPVRVQTTVAPTKSSSKKNEPKLDFFKTPDAFKDGYDIGDITKTILGTASDIAVGSARGLAHTVEGVGDLINYGIAGVSDMFGADDFADSLRASTKKDLTEKLLGKQSEIVSKNSVLGRTSQGATEMIGQLATMGATGGLSSLAGLGKIGSTILTTGVLGTSATGSGMSEAYQSGATDEEALTYGVISGTVESISEMIFGGLGKSFKAVGFSSGLSSADDIFAKKLTSKLTNQIMKNCVEYGVKAGAEGFEEVLAGLGQAVGKKLTYMSEKELAEIVKDENLLEQWVIGTIGSGFAQSVDLYNSNKSGTDFVSGLTQDEQSVVDKEVENRVAEKEADGKKLTNREKNKIYDAVIKDLDKGYISTDTIEEVLGGETYKTYKDTVDKEDALYDKFEKLGEKVNPTLKDQHKYSELAKLVEEHKSKSQRTQLKSQLSDEVFNLAKNSRLVESYNEVARRGQTFEADLSKYDAKQQEVVKKAVESGILNNTNRTHEFVDMVAKISADKGVLFEFANNEKIKESGFAVDGKTVNGYKTDDGNIAVNIDSKKALNSVVGHEITHILEGTELYSALADVVQNYATTKGEYQERMASLRKLYTGVYKGEDFDQKIREELTADIVGDYLFTDTEFINRLSTENRNVFQKIYDEIKYLCKIATAGSKEARELEKVKRAFEKAYKESANTKADSKNDVKLSMSEGNYGYHAGDLGKAEGYWNMTSSNRSTGHFGTGTYFVGDEAQINGEDTYGNRPHEKVDFSKYNLYKPLLESYGFELHDQLKYINNNISLYPIASMSFEEMYDAVKQVEDAQYTLYDNDNATETEKAEAKKVLAEIEERFESIEFDSENMYSDELKEKLSEIRQRYQSATMRLNSLFGYNAEEKINSALESVYNEVSQIEDSYNARYEDSPSTRFMKAMGYEGIDVRGFKGLDNTTYGSVIYDLKGEDLARKKEIGTAKYSLSAEQEDYFKDSVVRDDNGNLKVMYHGTSKGGHTVFDTYGSNYGLFGQGSYFTDNKSVAESYTNKGKGNNKQVYETYLNITNPIDMDADADVNAWQKALPEADFSNCTTNEDCYRAMEEYFEDEQYSKYEASEIAIDTIQSMGYDGITHIGGGRVNADGTRHQVYIAFEPEQIKNIDNIAPTKDADIRYSLTADSEGNKLTENQQKYFKDSKAVDNNGNLLKVYHTTNSDFTVFDKSKKGEATGDTNTYLGFFFSDDAEYMQNFPEFKNGKTEAYYLNMTNPIDMTNISKEAFLDVVEVLGGDVDEASIVFDDEGGGNLIALLDEMTGDATYRGLIEELKPHYDELMSKGYDGVINSLDEDYGAKEYIVLDSNQAKLTTNQNPTSDADIRYSLSSMANTFFEDPNMSANDFMKVDYKQTQGYKDYVEQCVNNYRQTRVDFDETVARKEVEDQIDGIVRVAIASKMAGYDITDDSQKRNLRDSKKRLLFSSLEPNSEYTTSHDISTLCDKRRNFAEIYDAIVKREEVLGVPQGKRFFDNVDNYFYIHKVLADKGLTQPCRQCYVESMRKNLTPMATAFLELVNETNPNNKSNKQLYQQSGKNKGNLKSNNAKLRERVLDILAEYDMSVDNLSMETLTTEDGLAQLRLQAPLVYEAFNSFYGQSKPKMPKSATPFRFGELTALLTDENGKIKQSLVDNIKSTGGFRLQSYSDFQIENFVDTLQVLFEAGTLGLNAHAYTKVPAFLDATEGTNLKRNISIFMYKDGDEWKLDKNDSFPYDLEEIYDIVKNDKSGNTGIIAVSQNADMSAWIMANDNIGYFIPFHKSGLKMGTVRDTDIKTEDGRIIKGYSGTIDHTKQQTEVWAKTTAEHKANTKVKKAINIYSFWDFDNKSNLSKNDLIKKNVKAYIDACEMAGYLPKFRDYVMNNDKVLNNVLNYSKKLGFVSEDATIDDISFEYKGYRIPYGYYKCLGDFGMFTPDGKASPHDTVSLANYDFDKAEAFFNDAQTLRRNEILQQFANGEEREKYRNSNLTAGELEDIVKQKRNEVADSIVAPTSYSLLDADNLPKLKGSHLTYGEDIKLRTNEDIAPVVENTPVETAEQVAPTQNVTIAPTQESIVETAPIQEAPTSEYESIKPRPEKLVGEEEQWVKNKMARADKVKKQEKLAEVLVEEPEVEKKKNRLWEKFTTNFVDRATPIETLALKTGNRELDGKFNTIRYADAKAQTLIGKGAEEKGVKPLDDIFAQVGNTEQLKSFFNYLYHKHNIDRMSLESREAPNLARLTEEISKLGLDALEENQLYAISKEHITKKTDKKRADLINTVREYLKSKGVKNKAVFGDSMTAKKSQRIVEKYETENPEYIEYAKDVYAYNKHLLNESVNGGLISQETADLFEQTYPHYVPIRREAYDGLAVNVPLDSRKTGVNTPIKRATGGSSNILPLDKTMATRTLQTYKAIAKNRFGVELKNTLGTTIESAKTDLDEVIESVDTHEDLLQKGKNGEKPTFTVFENGERVKFEITEAIYDALKPTSEGLATTVKPLKFLNDVRRGLITEYNPAFMLTNPIKDSQDVLLNSQHPVQTYKNFPKAIEELTLKNGRWYKEYMENGGEQNTYFEKDTNTFKEEKTGIAKLIRMPLDKIGDANNFIERIPRLAEYIASREAGRSIDVSMLDSARVTTNFSAGGDVTKLLNRNGATFLNASVQGAVQQVRNVREAKYNGLKGWTQLVAKTLVAGLPAMLLNGLLWDDDEEYEELSDYVKENYYIVAKFGDGQFVRIPKGRTVAVIQNAFEQIGNALTGDDEVDLKRFTELVISNLAPNNPLDNNIIAPIKQAIENKTWYGEDLVPSRLQDLPTNEQYDESTDSISKWLGENFDPLKLGAYKINYLLDQYSGGIGDMVLPMLTPEAESGNNSFSGNLLAPIKDKFTTDSVMNNQAVSDFYETSDELTTNAKSSKATDEDILKYKYFSSVQAELGELYAQKREVQNSNLSDDVKYRRVRNIQEQINMIAENSLNTYGTVNIDRNYANVGDKHYHLNDENEWQKINDKQLKKQREVTSGLNITPAEYWNNKTEYDYAYESPEKYAVAKAVGGYSAYKTYSSELYDIKADKDSNGKSISGSRKAKVLDYINNLDIDYYEKLILFKSEYNADDTYNYEIIEYLDSRDDISWEEEMAILKELGFNVNSDGYIWWD